MFRLLICFCYVAAIMTPQTLSAQSPDQKLLALSQELLYAVKTGDSTDSFAGAIANYDAKQLELELDNDQKRKAFWLNMYNAYTQLLLAADTKAYQHRSRFFSQKKIMVAGLNLGLDDVEHGLLRRSKIKLSLGYLNKPFPAGYEKRWRVQTLDNRIHFALNCGATSCPPIAFYDDAKIDQQLDMATANFVKHDVVYDSVSNKVAVSRIFLWFRGDFGGKKGTIALLIKYKILPEGVKPGIDYKSYDWTLQAKQFTQ